MGRSRISQLSLALVGVLLFFLGGLPAAGAGEFPVSVTTTAITGQEGKMLLIFAQPQGGGDTAVVCVTIETAFFETPVLQMKEMPAGGNPCEGGTPDASIPAGNTVLTAGVYVPGSQTPDKQVTATVDVQSDRTWQLDGVAVSADTAGDADCDRDADAVDALQVLRNVAGLGEPASCLPAGNLECDDGITAVDALMILRFAARLPLNLPLGCPSPFAAPILVSPEDGAVIQTDVNRLVGLDWDASPGAGGYSVQVDCLHCCEIGQYCSDVGRGYSFATNLTETEYTVPDLTGDNTFRWRVWANSEDGTPGEFSGWRTFDVDSSGQ